MPLNISRYMPLWVRYYKDSNVYIYIILFCGVVIYLYSIGHFQLD